MSASLMPTDSLIADLDRARRNARMFQTAAYREQVHDLSRKLAARAGELEARLEDGERKMREAEAQGQPVPEWEDFWLTLLTEYEAAYDATRGTAQ